MFKNGFKIPDDDIVITAKIGFALGERAPMTESEVVDLLLRSQIQAIDVDDRTALRMKRFYPPWEDEKEYAVGVRVTCGDVLYRCGQAHTSQKIYPPNIIPAIWVAISEDAGTQDAPVTAVRGMEYEVDKCYIDLETNKLYRCTRGGILQYLPHELVGIYFEEVPV